MQQGYLVFPVRSRRIPWYYSGFDDLDFLPLLPVTAPLVEITEITSIYRGAATPALDRLTLDIRPGTFFGLLGPNGAGKSTLLSTLCGLLTPAHGGVRVQGMDVRTEGRRVKAILGLVPQELALYPTLTARENLNYFGRMQGLAGPRLKARIDACLAIARLEEYADRRTETYSGGLKRRLNLVIGLIHEPRLLILDEPTVGIDPQSRNFIHEGLRQLHRSGMTIIYSTHYMEEAENLCDDIGIIDRGRIIARGTVPELLRSHRSGTIEVQVGTDLPEAVVQQLRRLPQGRNGRFNGHSFSIESDTPDATLRAVLETLHGAGLSLISLSLGAMNLEQVFLSLTGKRLRE